MQRKNQYNRGKEYWPRAGLKYFDAVKDEVTTSLLYNQEDRVFRETILPKLSCWESTIKDPVKPIVKKEAGHSAWVPIKAIPVILP